MSPDFLLGGELRQFTSGNPREVSNQRFEFKCFAKFLEYLIAQHPHFLLVLGLTRL